MQQSDILLTINESAAAALSIWGRALKKRSAGAALISTARAGPTGHSNPAPNLIETSVDQGRGRVAARWSTTSMIANRHSQAALLKSQIDQIDHRLKELEKSASSLRAAMVHLRERMEAALPPPSPPPLLVPKEGYMVRWNKLPKDASPEAEQKREYMRNYMRGRRQRLLEAQ
jgi:hypothetical protein